MLHISSCATMTGSNSSTGGGGSSSPADKFLSAFKDSLKKFPFDPVCGPAQPQPSSLISIMSSSTPVVGSASGEGSSSGGSATGTGSTASGWGIAAAGGSGGRVLDRLLPSSLPQSIVQSKATSADGAIISASVQWPTFSSFTDQLEAVAGEYMMAISVGAALGAAVAAGIGMGCVAASGLTSGVRYVVPTFWYGVLRTRIWVYDYLLGRETQEAIENGERIECSSKTNTSSSPEGDADVTPRISNQSGSGQSAGEEVSRRDACASTGAKTSCLGSGESKIYVIRAGDDVTSSLALTAATSAEGQCRQCLDGLVCELGKKLMGLQHVRRLTAYLVTGSCDAFIFRSILTKEYPISLDDMVLSVIFVQRLELEGAVVQVEALASL